MCHVGYLVSLFAGVLSLRCTKRLLAMKTCAVFATEIDRTRRAFDYQCQEMCGDISHLRLARDVV
jgi:hypothetical protein